jgi:pimeloyl-ACP methyl ester carboxylesterase
MAYREWGDPDNPQVLVCVHGVTRVGRDFDNLARALCKEVRVVCPDVVGRGSSGKLANPALYQVPQYVADMVTLLARILRPDASQKVAWLGTSMGGMIGMGLASLPQSPISSLILNDVGPTLNRAGLSRIAEYLGKEMYFSSLDEATRYIREISLPFGPHSDEEWRKLAADVVYQLDDGRWTRNYDIGIAVPFSTLTEQAIAQNQLALWAAWDAITCPVLLVRGAESDLLLHETALEMTQRGPKAKLVELAGVGHAPTFVHDDQILLVRQFLHLNQSMA